MYHRGSAHNPEICQDYFSCRLIAIVGAKILSIDQPIFDVAPNNISISFVAFAQQKEINIISVPTDSSLGEYSHDEGTE